MSQTLDTIKEELNNELKKPHIDFAKVAELTETLLEFDQEAIRFSVDARHVHRLGYELVGKQETALAELIKNSYDADATEVFIDFKDYSSIGGTLIIRDNGNGMAEDIIRSAWMRLSTSDKEDQPVSPKYGRSRAGRKGIGRFAVERLGTRLILESRVAGEETGIKVSFDWDANYHHGKNLTHIANKTEKFPKERNDKGLTLIISDLRDQWTEKGFERVWKSVLLLQPPFEIPKRHRAHGKEIREYEADPGFKVFINGTAGAQIAEELSIEKSFLEHGLAKIRGRIDNTGEAHFYVESPKLQYDDSQQSEKDYLVVGPLQFEVIYFVYNSKLMTGFSIRKAEEMGEKYGGIRIYRDGFRVLPYGEQGDDWLRLAYDTGRRNLLVPGNNSNFFGHIEVSSVENPFLEETSSREGLIENEAYEELRDFVRSCVEWAVLRIAAFRKRKQTAGQKNFVSEVRKPSEGIQAVITELTKIQSLIATDGISIGATQTIEKLTQIKTEIEKLTQIKTEQERFEAEAEQKELEHIEYEGMLRILASLGISIAVFSHEVRGALTRIQALLKELEPIKIAGKKNDAKFGEMQAALDRLYDLSSYILSEVSHSASREKQNVPLRGVIEAFVKQFKKYLNTRGIEFQTDIQPPFLRTQPMHRSEIDSILFNFLTNAVKSMDRASAKERRIKITATKSLNYAVINFQDSGEGIPKSIQHKIFDAFFTTAQYHGDEIAGPGSGLGLKIVSDIASANGGYVRLSKPEMGYACNFEFAVPIAKEQE